MIFHIPVSAPLFVSQQQQVIYPGLPRCADSTSCESAVQAAGRSMRTSHILPHRSLSLSHWERASVVGSATSSIQDTVCLELDMHSRTGAFFANLTRQILSQIPLSDVRTGTAAAFCHILRGHFLRRLCRFARRFPNRPSPLRSLLLCTNCAVQTQWNGGLNDRFALLYSSLEARYPFCSPRSCNNSLRSPWHPANTSCQVLHHELRHRAVANIAQTHKEYLLHRTRSPEIFLFSV